MTQAYFVKLEREATHFSWEFTLQYNKDYHQFTYLLQIGIKLHKWK